MRRCITSAITLVAAVAGVACEDGPSQTYATAPPNAGNLWNNGNTPALVTGVDASLNASFSGSSKTEICGGAELQQQWAAMVAQPLFPPYLIAGVNLAGWNVTNGVRTTTWETVTIEQVENGISGALYPVTAANYPAGYPASSLPPMPTPPTRLCQGAVLGQGGNSGDIVGGTLLTSFGQNNEFLFEWAVNTHKDYFVEFNPGYTGTMEWTFQQPPSTGLDPSNPCILYGGCDGKLHTYVWALGRPITDNGKDFIINWAGGPAEVNQDADILYRGMTQTFAPDLYDNLTPGISCTASGRCSAWTAAQIDGVHPELAFRTVSMYFYLNPSALPQPSGSTPWEGYIFNVKYAPYSPAISLLDMSTAKGPYAYMTPIGDMGKSCNNLDLGDSFGNLQSNCIEVFKDPTTNATGLAKVLGNLTHDDQNFSFSIVGVNQNYRPPELDIGHTPGAAPGPRAFDVIHDGEQPAPTATAVDFTLDVRAFGAIQNDKYPTATTGVWHRDDHGAGAMYREYGRMVQEDLAARYATLHGTTPRALHDPACLFPPGDAWGPPVPPTTGDGGVDGGVDGGIDAGAPDTGTTDAAKTDAGYFSGPQQWHAAPGCTGFEGWIDEAYPNVWAYTTGSHVAGMPVDPSDPTKIDNADSNFDVGYWDGSISNAGLRPGTPYSMFCMDPDVEDFCGSPSLYGNNSDLLDASLAMVLQIMGDGDINNLPSGVGDRRYFFMMYNRALAKYFFSGAALHTGACGGPAANQPGYCSGSTNANADPVPYFGDYQLNTDDMFFDSFGRQREPLRVRQLRLRGHQPRPDGLQPVGPPHRLQLERRALLRAARPRGARALHGDAERGLEGGRPGCVGAHQGLPQQRGQGRVGLAEEELQRLPHQHGGQPGHRGRSLGRRSEPGRRRYRLHAHRRDEPVRRPVLPEHTARPGQASRPGTARRTSTRTAWPRGGPWPRPSTATARPSSCVTTTSRCSPATAASGIRPRSRSAPPTSRSSPASPEATSRFSRGSSSRRPRSSCRATPTPTT